MKIKIYLLLISLSVFTGFNYYQNLNTLSYTESSSGIEQGIAFESGRGDLKIADINNDGFPDIISLGDHGNPSTITGQHGIMVWFGNGTGANWSLSQFGNFG